MKEWYFLVGFGALIFGLWVLSVELRLKAAQLMGEIVVDDFYERGKVTKELHDSICK
jgi:hypothetical protein